ncbi:unnamed protein product [Coffea canephora]|uniref:Uncharacterized protein n=1 Tax=Coffea canephora TaxID=49390 RepID=A0A068UKK1_COFCA|nr:unnamed protein product [Coffea canephora]
MEKPINIFINCPSGTMTLGFTNSNNIAIAG